MAIGRKDLRTDTERLMDKARQSAINKHDHKEKLEQMETQRKMVRAINGMDRETKRARPVPAVSPIGNPDLLTDQRLKEIALAVKRVMQYDWPMHARPSQLAPDGDWKIWLAVCGRGYGKTRMAAEYVRAACMGTPGITVCVIAQDHRALRDVVLEGESGLVACTPPEDIKKIHRGLGDVSVEFVNGSKVICYTAGEPDAVRGQSFALIWGDEFAAWPKNKAEDMLDQAQMCLRRSPIGARCILTTTPKRLPHVIKMLKDADDPTNQIVVTRGTSRDNTALSEDWFEYMERKMGGTRMARQELLGEMVMDVDNALWTGRMIDDCPWPGTPIMEKGHVVDRDMTLPKFVGVFTGVDPSGSKDGDEMGIVTCGWTKDGTIFVLENKTTGGEPGVRFRAACMSAYDNNASEIWYESAYGGDQAAYGIEMAWKDCVEEGLIPMEYRIKIQKSTIPGDKASRAGSVVQLYEQQLNRPEIRNIYHVPHTPENKISALEDEMLSWSTNEKKSPNAIDAAVHCIRAILRKTGRERATITSPASPHSTRRINRGYNPFGR